jgi:ATP phosphoribosyltransferase regulatory subunit
MQITEEIYTSWIPHGFDTYNPDETRYLQKLKSKLRALFESKGFSEIMLPGFDYARTFRITGRGSNDESIFELRDTDGELLAVRSDLTVQVIKAAANHRFGNTYPMRLSYFQPVFQDLPTGSGRKREIHQAGIEIIGSETEACVYELLSLAGQAMDSVNCPVNIIYGDARFLEILFGEIPVSFRKSLSAAFHNKDTSLISHISKEAKLSAETSDLLRHIPLIFGEKEVFTELKNICKNRDDLLSILNQSELLTENTPGIIFDFSMVKELSYYTGPVFEAYARGSRIKVLSGGIYNNLYNTFTRKEGEHKNAGGFAVDLTGLLHIQKREII